MLCAPWRTTQCCSNKGSHTASLQNNQKPKESTSGHHYWRMWLSGCKVCYVSDCPTDPGKWKWPSLAGDLSIQGNHASFRGFSSVIHKRKGCSNSLPGPFPLWILGFKKTGTRSQPRTKPRMWSEADLSAWGPQALAACQNLLALPPSLACSGVNKACLNIPEGLNRKAHRAVLNIIR